MRQRLMGIGIAVTLLAGTAMPAPAQFITTDARRVGMGGLSFDRGGALRRYNPAYRAVPDRPAGAGPRISIPIPLGLFQVLNDSAAFDTDSAYWNPLRLLNYVLNPPLFYEIKKAPIPSNDVELTIGKNELIVDLDRAQALIPSDEFGLGGSSRVLDVGSGYKGVRVGVTGWLHYEAGFRLGDTLRAFLKEATPADTKTAYDLLGDVIAQGGFAPTVSFAGRIAGDSARGLYVGAAARYFLGTAYARTSGRAGFITGDTIFEAQNPVTPLLNDTTRYSSFGNALGTGFGVDVGVAWVSGPVEIGVGVNDIGATLTWSDTRIDRAVWDTAGDTLATTTLANHVETETELPVSWIANLAYEMNAATTLGAQVVNTGRGTRISIGGEQRVGVFALRGGVSRDQRKRTQFAWGGGLRLGAFGLDMGFWTHSNSFSDRRAITMATSIALY